MLFDEGVERKLAVTERIGHVDMDLAGSVLGVELRGAVQKRHDL
jgi:hypothetical protein